MLASGAHLSFSPDQMGPALVKNVPEPMRYGFGSTRMIVIIPWSSCSRIWQ